MSISFCKLYSCCVYSFIKQYLALIQHLNVCKTDKWHKGFRLSYGLLCMYQRKVPHLFPDSTISIDDYQSSQTYFLANLLELSGELLGHNLWDQLIPQWSSGDRSRNVSHDTSYQSPEIIIPVPLQAHVVWLSSYLPLMPYICVSESGQHWFK